MGENHKDRNFIYVIEKRIDGRWQPNWDVSCFLTYDITEQIMQDFERYNKHPEDFRIVVYISSIPVDQ